MVVKGRALKKFEIARRKTLRRVGVGKPLFRGEISSAASRRRVAVKNWNTAVSETDAAFNTLKTFQERKWNNKKLSHKLNAALKKAELAESAHANEANKANINYDKISLSRKHGIKGTVRIALAGPKALARLKRIRKIKSTHDI